MTRRTSRSFRAAAGLLATVALVAFGASTVGAKPKSRSDSGVVYTALTYGSGGYNYAAGNLRDKIFKSGAVTYKIKVLPSNAAGVFHLNVPAVTLYVSNGSFTGTGSATLTVAADGSATVTNGKLTLTNGAGAQKGHTLKGNFTGTGSVKTGVYKFNFTATVS